MQEQPRQGGQQHTYFVDDMQQHTTKDELSVQRILEKAGIEAKLEEGQQPLLVELREGQRVEHTDLTEKIRIRDDARFEAVKAGGGGDAQFSANPSTPPVAPAPGRAKDQAGNQADKAESEAPRPPSAKDADRPPRQS